MANPDWILRFEGFHPFHRVEAFFKGEKKKILFCNEYNALMGISKNKRLQVYYIKKDLERISKKSFRILKNKKKIYSYIRLVNENNNNIITSLIEDTILKINFLSNEELSKRYERIIKMFEILVCGYDLSRPEYTGKTGIKIKKYLLSKKVIKNDLNKIFEILTTARKYTLLDYEEIDWLVLIQDMKNTPLSKVVGRLKEHEKKYGWIGTSEQNETWNIDYYKKRFMEDIKLSEKEIKEKLKLIKKKKKELAKKQSMLIDKFRINRKFRYLLYILKELACIRLTTRFAWVKSSFLMKEIFKEISKRTNVNENDLEWYNAKEINDLLLHNKEINPKRIKGRNNYAFVIRNNRLEFYEGEKKVKQLELKEIKKKDYSNITEIKGNPANLGHAVGKVKIIYPFSKNQQQEIDKMEEGQILVTSMTRPHLIMAMKKSAGIVTDEGGITSHAAIVSRELNIPCIIGTKIATKVFKDNDLVEVDANKGIVRLLKEK